MKHFNLFVLVAMLIIPSMFAAEPFYADLNKAQRFDLANAYGEVAEVFQNLGQAERARAFMELKQRIFSGSEEPAPSDSASIAEQNSTAEAEKIRVAYMESSAASSYYFQKLIRALNAENLSLSLSVLANTIYIPGYQDGIEKTTVSKALNKFFDEYNLESVNPRDVFDVDSGTLAKIPNDTWRLSIPVKADYQRILDAPFRGEVARFYFRKLPVGWRLIAMDTTN